VEADADLVAGVREGDEDAFVTLINRYQQPMLRLASSMVPNRSVAEEVVQDTWMGVVRGIDRFEGRASLKTWLFRILANRARSAAWRERTTTVEAGPAVDSTCFDTGGAWAAPVQPWSDDIDARIDAASLSVALQHALKGLPDRQRQVVLLRDVECLTGQEVCDVLSINSGTQRILLHRGRTRLRDSLDPLMKRA
jgi:RNA polymerase sigma-70 factor (ECF subfamily)